LKVNIDPTFKPWRNMRLCKSTTVVVENGFESSKRARPLGSNFIKNKRWTSIRSLVKKMWKTKLQIHLMINLEEEKIGKRVFFPKTLPFIESVSFDDQIFVVKILFLLKIFSFLRFP
jgi:hypothetical protein